MGERRPDADKVCEDVAAEGLQWLLVVAVLQEVARV